MLFSNDGAEIVMVKWDDLLYLVNHTVTNTCNEDFIRQVAEDFIVDESEVSSSN